jgi:adenylate cyclase
MLTNTIVSEEKMDNDSTAEATVKEASKATSDKEKGTQNSNENEALWYTIFAEGHPLLQKYQRLNKRLPSPPRCKLCYAPFRGVGSVIMKMSHRGPSSKNPRYCSKCDSFIRAFPGGAEVEMSMVFVDVRGSTPLAEGKSPTEYAKLMSQFYEDATAAFIETEGFVQDVVGDEVFALYPPGFSGKDHAALAIQAAEKLLQLTLDPAKLPMGIGVHTGVTYIGSVVGAEEGIAEVRVMGDVVNTANRICSAAGTGEALVSAQTCKAAGLSVDDDNKRELDLKGKSDKQMVRVMKPRGQI